MTTEIETKMASAGLSDDFAATFAAFRAANDERLAEIERKSATDPLLEAKVDRINRRLETLSVNLSQPAASHAAPSEAKSAWSRFIRNGDEAALSEVKSLSTSDGQGGFVAPVETENRIDAVLAESSPIRRIATVRRIGAGLFRKPVSRTAAATGWVGETEPRPQTTAPDLRLMEFPAGELYAMPAATQALLDDSVADVDAWLADEVRDVFAAQETAAFVGGDGTNKPKGFLTYQGGADALTEVTTGTDGALTPGLEFDAVISLIYAPKTRYRDNGSFVMNRRTLSELRKVKDDDGNYIWQPAAQAGQPSTLMGYAVTEAEDMPDIGSGSTSIAFGDFRRGYLIADRQGVRVLRDPYSAKPYVLFYTTKRVGGGVQDKDAIALLKFGV
ncbi:MAG: phage major capsid protein [Pseudomonadota bacterium]